MNEEPAISTQESGEQKTGQQTARRAADQHDYSGGPRKRTGKARSAKSTTGGQSLGEAKERLRTLKQDTDDYVRKNPTKAVFTALGIGFVLGLMRRR